MRRTTAYIAAMANDRINKISVFVAGVADYTDISQLRIAYN
jgi:hypothetical protein